MKTKCIAIVVLCAIAAGCDKKTTTTTTVSRLHIPKGNAEQGKNAFIALKCTDCHTVSGVDLPKPANPPSPLVELGGDVARLRSVGDLLTSIIHPDYRISEKMPHPPGRPPEKSPMRVANDTMTVTQMIDLVTFLQPHYKQLPIPYGWDTLP